MTKKNKDKIVIEELRDEIQTLNGRISNLEQEIRALTFYHVNPNGLVFAPSCNVNNDTAQWTEGKVFNHKIAVTFIDPKTMQLVSRDIIKHHGQVNIKIGRHDYDLQTGNLTVYLTVTQDDVVREYRLEHNLRFFFEPNIPKVFMQAQTNPLLAPNWIKIPANIVKGSFIFS